MPATGSGEGLRPALVRGQTGEDGRPALDEAREPVRGRGPRARIAWTVALAGTLLGLATGAGQGGEGRTAALVGELGQRGLQVDPEGVVWLEQPPLGLVRATVRSLPAVVRAAPNVEEPHDIYLVDTRLSPEGVLLEVGAAYNLTETSAVDEQRPVGHGSRFAFVERSMLSPDGASRVRLLDLAAGAPESVTTDEGADDSRVASWTRLQQVQAAITRLQQTGRLDGVGRWTYSLSAPAEPLSVALTDGALRIGADDKSCEIPLDRPLQVPEWLTVERALESKPGTLVTWAVDRVRSIPWVGDNTMQYVKAIAFSVLDVVLRGKEAMTGDTGAADIAADLGQDSLEASERATPVDPEIGFPPPALEPWVTPALPGEGRWNRKDDDPFIRKLPGLPPAFVTTFIRGDRKRKATRVYIALWDPRQVELHTMAGVAEPKSATGKTGPGLIPREPKVLGRVAAACNAGFQSLHGEYGMMSDGVIYLPPKPYAATVAVLRDGSTAFGTWPLDLRIPDDMLSYRQNMTPMVLDGTYNPYGRTWWGGTPSEWEDKTHTTRTGICLTEQRFVGYFYGSDISPAALGRAMIQARCSFGVALDMNAGHSGLEFYHVAPEQQMPPLDRPLRRDWEREGKVPRMEGWTFRARRLVRGMGLMYFPRYIKREGRDYFYLTLRYLLPGAPLEPAAGGPPAQWQIKGLAQHGFPYAVALAETSTETGQPVRVLKIDPRVVTPFRERALQAAVAAAGAGGGDAGGAEAKIVVSLQPRLEPSAARSVWATPDAFAVHAEPPLPGAVRLAAGVDVGKLEAAPAAIGVLEDAGMLAYVETVADGAGASPGVPPAELAEVLGRLGSLQLMVLDEPLPLALGGDTDLAGQAIRLPAGASQIDLYRKAGPGGRRVFPSTPVVPLKEWFPLQARRIRYFKKKKEEKKDDPADP